MTNRLIVVKIGGAAINSGLGDCCADLVALQQEGWRAVIVYGGGPEISARMRAEGIEPQFVNGLRVTDETAMAIVKSVLTEDVGPALQRQIAEAGMSTQLLTGEEGRCVLVEPKSEDGVSLGFVGEIVSVNPAPIEALIGREIIPLMACIGCDSSGRAFNVNGDLFAAAVARALQAECFVIVTDVAGIRGADGQILDAVDAQAARAMIEAGIITGGMIPKVNAALSALDRVRRAHIIDGESQGALRRAVSEGTSDGTALQRVTA